MAVAVALAAGRAAPAQLPGGTLPPPPQAATQLPPPAGLPVPSPRPQLVPADATPVPGTMPFLANPTPPAALPILAPTPTMTLSKPAGAETTRPAVALPVSRSAGGTVAVPVYQLRPQLVPATTPVAAQAPPAAAPGKLPDVKPSPEPSPEDKAAAPKPESKDAPPPIAVLDPRVAPIDRGRAFRLDDDAELNKRILDELVEFDRKKFETDKPGQKFVFEAEKYALPPPAKVGATGVAYVPKTAGYSPTAALIEPGYVVHRRLLFEEKNSERHGWDLGFIQPLVSTAAFYKDTLLYPAHVASNLYERYDTSAGKCLPGSPVPYYLYPEEITLFGATVGALAILGTAYVAP